MNAKNIFIHSFDGSSMTDANRKFTAWQESLGNYTKVISFEAKVVQHENSSWAVIVIAYTNTKWEIGF